MFQEVFAPDERVMAVLHRQNALTPEELRWSVFLFPFQHRSRCYLYHSLTKQCLRVDTALFETASSGGALSDAWITGHPEWKELAEQWFLVPAGKDETAVFDGLQRILRLRMAQRRLSAYTILPTTACNASCFYCVEQWMHPSTMSRETEQELVRFILRTRDPAKRIQLRWFGGEPLLAAGLIDRVSAALEEAGVDFEAAMISNGILIDETIAAKMTGPWRLRRIQISLDGAEEEYNRRKSYLRGYPSAYRSILNSLRLLMDTGIQVVLRCNVDRDNAGTLRQMVDDLADALPRKGRFYPYFTLLYGERESERHAELFQRCLEAKVYARDRGFPYVPQAPLHRMRHTVCMAENPYGSTVIDPEGRLFNCDMTLPGTEHGTLWEGVTRPEYLKTFVMPEPVAEKCRDCCFLTSCTTFSRCPTRSKQCRKVRELELLTDLRCELDRMEAMGAKAESDGGIVPDC